METRSLSDSAGAQKAQNATTVMDTISGTATHIEANIEHIKPSRMVRRRRCSYVAGEIENEGQESAMGMTYDSHSTMTPGVTRPKLLTLSPSNSSISSPRGRTPHRTPPSPGRTAQRSPLQANSPASLIFERSVQEDILLPQTSPSIPSHIRTENHIPPVLEASSAAITDNGLDPESVEIITRNIHHPATAAFHAEHPLQSHSSNSAMNIDDSEEIPTANQGLEANDIRRLSFISFADVINAENAETSEYPLSNESCHRASGSPNPSARAYRNMSPSSLHSPTSSHGFGTSPPTSISASFNGLELSPNRGVRGAESPLFAAQRPASPSFGGDLNIETMGQALRRTGSGDLGAFRNQLPNTMGAYD
ncbi:uncharacterized protein DSM5745_03842 [Aspergillus mulundensis]|uniref:Uncharacterized protein n=1 Tax=Aspergillus mulundensis TaxID=1810919 RepID=A0A3D8SLL4_9EURO|nr:Uncharacterized protein DSM5745_03842 [Aspergillus mulundensis]RDW87200.1 Uncharacterized protein DSM5745_03842 [Aspergillus mulundensis]